jgi:hypothetical protein
MKDKVGEVAGLVWRHLEEKEESSPSKIAKKVEASQNKVYMALGWLAKEDKLEFTEKGRGKTVKLK